MSLYDGYLKRVSMRFRALCDEIQPEYNFEAGSEFEITICKALSLCLPEKFGVCRGHVVSAEGEIAGDDIIIYDRMGMPLLHPRAKGEFAQKQKVPIEAVYAYIEAKCGLTIKGDGVGSLQYAIHQVGLVRKLVETREKVPLSRIQKGVSVGGPLRVESGSGLSFRNPLFTAIVCQRAGVKKTSIGKDSPEVIQSALEGCESLLGFKYGPDFVALGDSICLLPFFETGDLVVPAVYRSPFKLGSDFHAIAKTDGCSFSVFICVLMHALERIELGSMPWGDLIAEGINLQAR